MNDLGSLQSVHKLSNSRLGLFISCAFIFFALFGLCLFFLLSRQPSDKSDSGAIMLAGIVTFGIGFIFIWLPFGMFNHKLSIYENGLCFSKGKTEEFVRWDEIESVYEAVINVRSTGITVRNYFYSVRTKDYRELKLDPNLKNIGQVGEKLKIEAEKRRIPMIWGTIEENPISAIPK